MNCDLSSTESVADNLENIPEIEVAFFHEGSSAFLRVLVFNDTTSLGDFVKCLFVISVSHQSSVTDFM